METRPSALGYCPSVRAVLGQAWWPGRFIYKASTYTVDGEERKVALALCPYCGKWVAVRLGDMIAHELPKGSEPKRLAKMDEAQEQYGRLVVKDLMRSQREPVGAVA